jgi:hypothetical protein
VSKVTPTLLSVQDFTSSAPDATSSAESVKLAANAPTANRTMATMVAIRTLRIENASVP